MSKVAYDGKQISEANLNQSPPVTCNKIVVMIKIEFVV